MRNDLPPLPPHARAVTNYSDTGVYPAGSSEQHMSQPPRSRSAEPLSLRAPDMPSARLVAISQYSASTSPSIMSPVGGGGYDEDDISPPASPVQEEVTQLTGPAVISAQMKCKVFLQQGHGQWKSLGQGKLKLYVEKARNVKQLVVENSSGKAMLISTIVLTDGVERVGRTGVAVEISDRGMRTGIIYMIQLRNETSAGGLYESLLSGSDRARGA